MSTILSVFLFPSIYYLTGAKSQNGKVTGTQYCPGMCAWNVCSHPKTQPYGMVTHVECRLSMKRRMILVFSEGYSK